MPNALARRFVLQVSTDNASWITVRGIADFNPQISSATQGVDDYDTNGWTSIEKTMQSWTLTVRLFRKYTGAFVFDAGQEILRAAQDQFGTAARVYVRWYDRNGGAEAYSGYGVVAYTPAQTGVGDVDQVTVTITGDGARTLIANPYGAAVSAAVINSILPSGQGTGKAVTINGANFAGATAVTFGGTAASSFQVNNDGQIIAVLPSGSAGSVTVIVTGTGGASAGVSYTRAA